MTIKKIKRTIRELESVGNFNDLSDYVDSLQKNGDFELLNNAVSKRFGYDWYNFSGITIYDFKKIIFNGFKSNGTLAQKRDRY